jgi:hypothetical protein
MSIAAPNTSSTAPLMRLMLMLSEMDSARLARPNTASSADERDHEANRQSDIESYNFHSFGCRIRFGSPENQV